MALDPQAKRFLDMLSAASPAAGATATVEDRRKAFRSLMGFSGKLPPIGRVDRASLTGPTGAVGVRVYTPVGAGAGRLPGLVFFHGGGLIAGSLDTHEPICRALANETGCRLISVDYRLAPEHKFPAALLDGQAAVEQVFREVEALGIDRQRIGIGGDSAGATLATVICRRAIDPERAPLAFQLLLCPIADFAGETESRRAFDGWLIDAETMRRDIALYLPEGVDPTDPRISPLRADDLRGLPRTYIHTAECDPLRDEGKAYADRLSAAGVDARYTCHPGMIHLFYAMAGIIPYAGTALRMIGGAVRADFA